MQLEGGGSAVAAQKRRLSLGNQGAALGFCTSQLGEGRSALSPGSGGRETSWEPELGSLVVQWVSAKPVSQHVGSALQGPQRPLSRAEEG